MAGAAAPQNRAARLFIRGGGALSCSKSAARRSVFEAAALDRAMDEAHAEREQEAAKAKVDISDCPRHPGAAACPQNVSHSALVGAFCTGARPLEGP